MDRLHTTDRETVTLNIGLENNAPFANMNAKSIADFMQRWLAAHQGSSGIRDNTFVRAAIVQPGQSNATERTAVIEYSAEDVVPGLLRNALLRLSIDLGQSCIAVWVDHDAGNEPSRGFLVGQGTDKYGEFDPSRFDIGPMHADLWATSDLVEEMQ